MKHEPKIGKGLKPDIYFEIGESLNNMRKVAIEVKVYRTGKEIPNKEVRKTHSLLKDSEIDYLIWISNKPLNNAKFNLPKSLHDRVGRSGELSDLELAYCSLLVNRDKLWDEEKIDPSRARQLLKSAGIDLEHHYRIAIDQVKNIGYSLIEQIDESDITLYFEEDESPVVGFKTSRKTDKVDDNKHDAKTEVDIDDKVDEIDEDQQSVVSHHPKLEGIYRDMIIKFIITKSHQKTMGINTIFTHMKRKKYDLEDVMNKDDAVILIRELAKEEGYRTQTTKIIFSK